MVVHGVLPLLPHIIGGRLNHFSKHPVRYKMWGQVCQAQPLPHADRLGLAVWVAFSDLYVRLVATGTITDLRFF